MTEQRFSIQFVVLRDGESITEVITIEGSPISLHEKHNPVVVWRVQAQIFVNLIHAELVKIDGLAGVVADARPVGLAPQRPDPRITPQTAKGNYPKHHLVAEAVGVPILKRVNAALAWLVKRLNNRPAETGGDPVRSDDGWPRTEEAMKDYLAEHDLKMVDYFDTVDKKPFPAPDDERSKPPTIKPRTNAVGGQDNNQRGLR